MYYGIKKSPAFYVIEEQPLSIAVLFLFEWLLPRQ